MTMKLQTFADTDHDLSDEEEEEDHRITVDMPVSGKGQFVSRVEDAVDLQGLVSKHLPLTIPSFFATACQRYKNRAVFSFPGDKTVTFAKYYLTALDVARGLLVAGLKPLEGVAFMCHNSARTFYAIMGSMMAGGIYVDLFAVDNKSWLVHTMAEARVSIVFVDSVYAKDIQLDVWDELPLMRSIIIMDEKTGQDSRILSMRELIGQGRRVNSERLARRLGMHAPNKCCAIFYRSNEILNQPSTPGIMMSHDNLTLMARLIGDKILHRHLGNFPDVHSKAIKLISILPITKPSAFVMEVLLPLAIGGCVHISNQKLSMASLWRLIIQVEPNIFCATTRIWIHLRNKVTDKTRNLPSVRGWLFKYAKRTMLDSFLQGSRVPKLSRMVIRGVSKQLGLSQVGLFFSFGGALPQNHYEYFLSLNIQIFALREVRYLSGPHSLCMSTDEYRTESMGTVFSEFNTKMVRLGKTAACRMFVRGRHVCMGILHESIADRVDSEGYLDTEALTLNIQDDLFFVGSTGDEVVLRSGAVLSYSLVESSFKRLIPIVANCMLVGENMKTAALLITLKTIINPETLQATDVLTQEVQNWCKQKLQTSYSSAEMLACSKKLHVVINGALVVINRLIKRSGGWIEAYKVLPRNFSILDMEIDPITHELNRNLILDRYRDDLVTLYPNQ